MGKQQNRRHVGVAGAVVVLAVLGLAAACVPDPGTPGPTTTTSPSTTSPSTTYPTTTYPTSSTTTSSIPTQQCNDATVSGGPGVTVTAHELGQTGGSFLVEWNMYSVPDQLDVSYQGVQIFTTGGPVSGTGSAMINYGPGASTQVVVTGTGPTGTLWDYTVHCPAV